MNKTIAATLGAVVLFSSAPAAAKCSYKWKANWINRDRTHVEYTGYIRDHKEHGHRWVYFEVRDRKGLNGKGYGRLSPTGAFSVRVLASRKIKRKPKILCLKRP